MLPFTALHNLPHATSCHSKSFGKRTIRFGARAIPATNFKNFYCSELSVRMLLPALHRFRMGSRFVSRTNSTPGAPLRNPVIIIVSIGPEKQVSRIHACLIIAAMQYVKAIRNFSLAQNPSYSGRSPSSVAEMKRSVTVRANATNPCPTESKVRINYWSVFIDLLPESFHSLGFQKLAGIAI